MKRSITLVLCLVLCCLLAACGQKLTLGTGGVGGRYYAYGQELEKKVDLTVKATAGSAANLRLLEKGFLDFAIVQSDTLLDAVEGKNAFAGAACKQVRAVAALYAEECQIVVRADSDISSVDDLYGKRISLGEEESGVRQNAQQILALYGIGLQNIQAQYLSFTDSAKALQNGELDAFFCTAGAPTGAVADLAEQMELRLISLDQKNIQRLCKDYACYSPCTIPAGTYVGQTEDVTTVGVHAILVAAAKCSDAAVQELLEALPMNTTASEGVPVAFHTGAADWYNAQGITVTVQPSSGNRGGVSASQE